MVICLQINMFNLKLFMQVINDFNYYAQEGKYIFGKRLTFRLPHFQKWKLKVNQGKTNLIVFTEKFTNRQMINPLLFDREREKGKRKRKVARKHLILTLKLQRENLILLYTTKNTAIINIPSPNLKKK